jgi:hypothetical protein
MPFDRDDEYYDPNEYLYLRPILREVTAHLHGGPRNGETEWCERAFVKLPIVIWDGNTPTETMYHLSRRWNGGSEAHYEFVEPPSVVVSIVRPRARRARLALRAARDAWRRAA